MKLTVAITLGLLISLFLITDVSSQVATLFPWEVSKSWYFTGGPHGWANTTGGSGLDFAPNTTTAVLAADAGEVYFAGWTDWGDGNNLNVRIRHANGWETWYLHLSSSAFGEDGILTNPIRVSQGQYLGEVGSTGASGVHIHIELVENGVHRSWNGRAINGWQVHANCTGYTGTETCLASNYNGYISNTSTGEQKVPNEDPGSNQLVQSSNNIRNAPLVVSGSISVQWLDASTNFCSGEFGLASPQRQVIFSDYQQQPSTNPVQLGPFNSGTQLVFYIRPGSFCSPAEYLSTSANARLTLIDNNRIRLSWEDLSLSDPGADKDYNDLVIDVVFTSDAAGPVVNWVAPVSNGQTYTASSGVVQLQVSASDPSGVVRVEFWRWDAVNAQWVRIATDFSAPYQASINIGTLIMGLNQIDADVYDNAGNWTTQSIWILRTSTAVNWSISAVGDFSFGQSGDIPVPGDYNGDGKDDIAVFRPSNNTWYVRNLGSFPYGRNNDIPVVADYNGDGKDDIAVFRQSINTWFIYGIGRFFYGTGGDIPVVGDYNGDDKDDIAVFREFINTWFIRGIGWFFYGTSGDIPVVGDYNGDGIDDMAVFRPSTSTWYIRGVGAFPYGTRGDIPVVGDYDGDGKDDIAIFRPSNSTWYIRGIGPFQFGSSGDIPVVADYNGDGKDDIAVFRP
jgi:murein DD-endopeptidase MepM/ murein hydrolase activator NlpD